MTTISLDEALNKIAAGDVQLAGHVGTALLLGSGGVKKDNPLAMLLLQSAAGNGHAAAFTALGVLYAGQTSGPKDLRASWAYFNTGAFLGDELAGRNRTEIEKFLSAGELVEARDLSNKWVNELAAARVAGKLRC